MIQIDPKTITPEQLRRCADILDTIALLGRTFHAVLSGKQPPEQTVHTKPPKRNTGKKWTPARRRKFQRTMLLRRHGKH